jgi:hypothetical protein
MTAVESAPPIPGQRVPLPVGRRSTDAPLPPLTGESGCRLVDLPRITDPRGNLTFVEGSHLPFEIRRVFYLYDVPGGESRGGHAHRALHQLVIAASGSFTVVVDDGEHSVRFSLNRSYYGLYVPPMTWTHLEDFSSGSVSLVLASAVYDEADYYRDHAEFVAARRALR